MTDRAADRPSCIEFADLYQHPVLDEGLPAGASGDDRRQAAMMVRKAENVCQSCPLLTSCLYDAVVKHDVSGYVAQTTPRQRAEIRRRLGVTVTPEDLDTLAGVTAGGRQVDHDEVVRLRRANPDESLETLAHRLGCSLSTVKRHLRRARAAASAAPAPAPRVPTPDEVVAVAREVVSGQRPRVAA
ncbi:sigma factor-like helix-turn-helix DNA-binding protein [Desertihabitans aurantiacus]|uniref:sigma factor-like helix-turn-helix DNA-binding protein n=1 Tax=Desertihabitans aurantiacus TaxID=2282477 RepID=UPI000DF808AD|nr:sigma factor-like helix-turn-helix DNA-binding protein [Desertihabitans aurantiacus]